ncbi:hypothetical protein DFS34DRAFT_362912 [Phlyctochytrium arcticum]|nr:hypothetical protein DFS34DRAFT_362912 [Phlyctochytrium arcticum]
MNIAALLTSDASPEDTASQRRESLFTSPKQARFASPDSAHHQQDKEQLERNQPNQEQQRPQTLNSPSSSSPASFAANHLFKELLAEKGDEASLAREPQTFRQSISHDRDQQKSPNTHHHPLFVQTNASQVSSSRPDIIPYPPATGSSGFITSQTISKPQPPTHTHHTSGLPLYPSPSHQQPPSGRPPQSTAPSIAIPSYSTPYHPPQQDAHWRLHTHNLQGQPHQQTSAPVTTGPPSYQSGLQQGKAQETPLRISHFPRKEEISWHVQPNGSLSVPLPMRQPAPQATVNTNQTCYCAGRSLPEPGRPMLVCCSCRRWFHQGCLDVLQRWLPENKPLLGDDFYQLKCKYCTNSVDEIRRFTLTWVDVIHLTLFNLTFAHPPRKQDPNILTLKYYGWKSDICAFIDANWHKFWTKNRTATWENTVASCLSTQKQFVAGTKAFGNDQGLWALATMALPSTYDQASRRMRDGDVDISPEGYLQGAKAKRKRAEAAAAADDTESVASAINSVVAGTKSKKSKGTPRTGSVGAPDINGKESAAAAKSRRPRRSKKKRVKDEHIDPATAIEIYPDIDNFRGPVQMSNDTTHRAPQMTVTDSGFTVHTDKGYRMGKATHGVWEGNWYFEAVVNEHQGHLRIGYSQISGDLQAPCGYDMFSYGYRDSPGTLFHRAKPIYTGVPEGYSAGYSPGDVLGVAIHLPPVETRHMDELLRRLWDRDTPYLPFRSRPLTVAKGSRIVYYRNGQCLGDAFQDLYLGEFF